LENHNFYDYQFIVDTPAYILNFLEAQLAWGEGVMWIGGRCSVGVGSKCSVDVWVEKNIYNWISKIFRTKYRDQNANRKMKLNEILATPEFVDNCAVLLTQLQAAFPSVQF